MQLTQRLAVILWHLVVEPVRAMKAAYLPFLMVYFAFGLTGITSIASMVEAVAASMKRRFLSFSIVSFETFATSTTLMLEPHLPDRLDNCLDTEAIGRHHALVDRTAVDVNFRFLEQDDSALLEEPRNGFQKLDPSRAASSCRHAGVQPRRAILPPPTDVL